MVPYLLIGLTIVAISIVGAGFVAAGWQFCLGFTFGFLFFATLIRIKYGFWVDP